MIREKDMNPLQEVVVTRRPIFDRKKEVFAYELLFKSSFHSHFEKRKTSKKEKGSELKAVDTLMLNGLKRLTGGKRALINFNRDMLVHEMPKMFPSDMLGVAVMEDADSDRKITEILEQLKHSGYLLIVDDRLFNEGDLKLVKMADIVGVDFRAAGLQKRFSIFEDDPARPRFLARSVETPSDFDMAVKKGYKYFQGNFFSAVDLISVRSIPSYKINLMRILKEINKPKVEFERIEQILKKDISITYKLLRFINSASFGLKTTVQSIRHALNLLGEQDVRKYLSLIVLSSVGTDKPQEMVKNTLVRARFCESIAVELELETNKADYFLLGMFSMVDALMGRPMGEILRDLPLNADVKKALLGKNNTFHKVLQLVRDYESGEWRTFDPIANKLKLDPVKISNLYMEAVEWGKLL
jgi:EAL and modified HD-GYP domain-containing signal transduction protein